jgi:hypothetical protein
MRLGSRTTGHAETVIWFIRADGDASELDVLIQTACGRAGGVPAFPTGG